MRRRNLKLFQIKLILLTFVYVSSTANLFAQDFKTIQSGVEYAEMTRGTKEEPVRINLLKLDLSKVRLDVVHALDAAIGLEKTSSIASRYGAFAAINAGFFRLDKSIFAGDEVGALKIDGKILSEAPGRRIALFIANNPKRTDVFINHLNQIGSIAIDKNQFDRIGINRERKADDVVVFTPEFHRTTLTSADGLEIVVQNGIITQIFDRKGSSLIPADGFVISASGKQRDEILPVAKIGAKADFYFMQFDFGRGLSVTNNTEGLAPGPSINEDIVSGIPLLVLNGKIEIQWQQEGASKEFVETRHPRTAVAKLKDGKFLMATIDGRQEGWSVGMNLSELAALLLELGAQDAMNLDGGGSTTMFMGGKVMNKPSDKEGERSVGSTILVFPRK
jgi:hypothetical protein